jgi:hypothetical protein
MQGLFSKNFNFSAKIFEGFSGGPSGMESVAELGKLIYNRMRKFMALSPPGRKRRKDEGRP